MVDTVVSYEKLKEITVLYVEDEDMMRESVVTLLKRRFKEVLVACNGAEALDVFKKNKVDVIITDLLMPSMTGLSLIREMKKRKSSIPIIIITAYGNTEMVKEIKALSVMTKTIDTIKEVENGRIVRTIDRSKLYNTQTPQAFEYDLILKAHQKFEGKNFTDDAGMLEELGETVYVIDGSYRNIKITTQSDIELAKVYLTQI